MVSVRVGQVDDRVRRGAGAQVMASLRNLAILLLRMAGATNIAEVLRHCARIRFDFELLRCTLLIDLHPPKLRDYCICYH